MTFHPETTMSKNENIKNLNKCLNCLKKLKNTSIIITMPGADHNYKIIYSILKKFTKKYKNLYLFKSLGSPLLLDELFAWILIDSGRPGISDLLYKINRGYS